VTDLAKHFIARFDDMTGTNWIRHGSLGAGVGAFWYPHGLAIDSTGKIYIADYFNERIVRIDDMNGTNWTTFPRGGTGAVPNIL
jgi:DNA-binding beta-propeller fold protein YncE